MEKPVHDARANAELISIRDRCLTIVGYLSRKSRAAALMESEIRSAFDKNDLRGLKAVVADLTEWARGLPDSERQELDSIMSGSFSGTLERTSEHSIDAVVRRGVIESDDEYRLLLHHVDELSQESLSSEEVMIVNKLLVDYEAKAIAQHGRGKESDTENNS